MPKSVRLFDVIYRRRYRELANRIAREVSQQCEENHGEWEADDLRGQSIDFLRGFVRAKVSGAIRLETCNALRRHHADPELQPVVTVLATEQLIDSTIRRMLGSRTDSTVARRAA